jgi:hypothetical protein
VRRRRDPKQGDAGETSRDHIHRSRCRMERVRWVYGWWRTHRGLGRCKTRVWDATYEMLSHDGILIYNMKSVCREVAGKRVLTYVLSCACTAELTGPRT